jgi:DNA-binding protein HU-beta
MVTAKINMKKSELVSRIASETELSRSSVEAVLNTLESVAFEVLGSDGEFTVPGIVKLKTAHRAARSARNPGTGEHVAVPERTVVTAKPLSAMKRVVETA